MLILRLFRRRQTSSRRLLAWEPGGVSKQPIRPWCQISPALAASTRPQPAPTWRGRAPWDRRGFIRPRTPGRRHHILPTWCVRVPAPTLAPWLRQARS